MTAPALYIGTAGWSIASSVRDDFPDQGTHLERYATRFNAVEINSSFYRPHRRTTYERWAGAVPEHFRFAVKVPKAITHERRLAACADLVGRFAGEVDGLGDKLGAILIQLPPSLVLDFDVARSFLSDMRSSFTAPLVCEPRHASWYTTDANAFLSEAGVSRVAADPALFETAGTPGGRLELTYRRLHGSPRVYYSNYDAPALDAVKAAIDTDLAAGRTNWCIFDNTAAFAAAANALDLKARFTLSKDQA